MKYVAFWVVFLCGNYHAKAQTCSSTVDSTTHRMQTISLDIPFIGVIELENPSYTFQNVTIPLQIPPIIKSEKTNESTFSEVDSIVSVRLLDKRVEATLVGVDSLDAEG